MPEVIAGIARDLMREIDAELAEQKPGEGGPASADRGKSVDELSQLLDTDGGTVPAIESGYLQFVGYAAAGQDRDPHRRGHPPRSPARPLHRRGTSARHGLAARGRTPGGAGARQGTCDGTAPDLDARAGVRRRPARGDRHPRPLACGERPLHRCDLHRLALGGPEADLACDTRKGRLPGPVRSRAPHRARPVLHAHGQPGLRQDPPGGQGHARRDHPPDGRPHSCHGGDHDRQATPGPRPPGGHGRYAAPRSP